MRIHPYMFINGHDFISSLLFKVEYASQLKRQIQLELETNQVDWQKYYKESTILLTSSGFLI